LWCELNIHPTTELALQTGYKSVIPQRWGHLNNELTCIQEFSKWMNSLMYHHNACSQTNEITHPTQTLYLNMKKLQKSKHTSQTTVPVSLFSAIKV
jgi:hypothetical protein